MSRPITERLAEAKRKMLDARKRTPRVFFLTPDDYAEFCRTGPDYDWVPFHQGGMPSELLCPLFEKIAVRQSHAKKPISQLFCCIGTSVKVQQ